MTCQMWSFLRLTEREGWIMVRSHSRERAWVNSAQGRMSRSSISRYLINKKKHNINNIETLFVVWIFKKGNKQIWMVRSMNIYNIRITQCIVIFILNHVRRWLTTDILCDNYRSQFNYGDMYREFISTKENKLIGVKAIEYRLGSL